MRAARRGAYVAGGRVFRYDLSSGTFTPLTPEDGPWYRRLALHPDGSRLLAEREGNLWMLETPGFFFNSSTASGSIR